MTKARLPILVLLLVAASPAVGPAESQTGMPADVAKQLAAFGFECKCIGKHGSQVPCLLPVHVAPNRRTLNPRPELASIT